MSFTKIFPFDTPANYTYDSSKIDITGGKALLKDLTPATSIFYANFNTNENGNWGAGILAGLLTGSASVSGGELDLTGGNATCNYNENNLDTMLNTGCIRIRWRPNYTGNAPSPQYLFQAATNNNGNILIRHNTNLMQAYIYDSSGTLIAYIAFGFSAVAGNTYELELNYDLVGGNHRFFVDGILEKHLTGTGVRVARNLFQIGEPVGMDSFIDGIIIFNTVQHTANYTPNWSAIPNTKYDTTNPIVEINETILHEAIDDFLEDIVKLGSDEIKYILTKDTVDYYWDGAAWSISNGTYSQSNTAAEILTNKATFTILTITTKIKILLHSDDGNTTPEINTLTVDFDYAGETPDDINICIVWGYSLDNEGNPSSTPFSVYLEKDVVKYKTKTILRNTAITVTPETTKGYWEAELVECENMKEDVKYIFNFDDRIEAKRVPNEEFKNYNDLY